MVHRTKFIRRQLTEAFWSRERGEDSQCTLKIDVHYSAKILALLMTKLCFSLAIVAKIIARVNMNKATTDIEQ
jgi:hypothetical protein